MRRRPRKEKDKCIIQLNNELKGTIVKKKKYKKKIMILEDYVLKFLIEHNYRLLEMDRGKNH